MVTVIFENACVGGESYEGAVGSGFCIRLYSAVGGGDTFMLVYGMCLSVTPALYEKVRRKGVDSFYSHTIETD